jgi:cytochrome c-type biogenesis protein CcmF
LKDETSLGNVSMLSREALFLLQALFFGAFFIVCFWGILSPLISEIATGQKITLGPSFYRPAVAPIMGAIIALMGIAPLSSWTYGTIKTIGRTAWKTAIPAALVPIVLFAVGMRNIVALIGFTLIAFTIFVTLYELWRGIRGRQKTLSENFFTAFWNLFSRNRRRYGGYIIHIAMVTMAIGILGMEVFQTTTQKTLATGESLELSGYTLRFDSLAQFYTNDSRFVTRAEVSIFKDGKFLGTLHPRYDLYPDGQPMTIAGVRSTPADDLYVVLVNWENISSQAAPFKVYHNPLVMWLWIGSIVFIIGTLVAAWPSKEEPARK